MKYIIGFIVVTFFIVMHSKIDADKQEEKEDALRYLSGEGRDPGYMSHDMDEDIKRAVQSKRFDEEHK